MKTLIGIDASRSNIAQKTGTEYYSFELIKKIVEDRKFNFRLYSKDKITYLKGQDNIEFKVMPFPKLWSQIRLSFEIIKSPPDALFVPAHTIPIYHGKKTIVTLHDVGFRYFPELYTPLERYYHDYCMRFSVKHATKIIAISEATKKDLMNLYHADEGKIDVIYHGFDKEKYFPLKKNDKRSKEIEDLGKYIFFIGRIEAKKNIVNLVKSYGILRRDQAITHKLVLAGRPGYQYEQIKEEIEKLPESIKKDVIELGYVSDDKVSQLMRFSDIFFFPSLFEGFGMPLVEAMASGIPIVASNTTSIPEIVQDAALVSDPKNADLFAENLSKLIKKPLLRDSLVKKGIKRASDFDWNKCAKETLQVIEKSIRT